MLEHVAWVVVFLAVSAMLHELGHAAASLALGLHVFEVVIGSGRAVTFEVAGVRVRLGLAPFSGHIVSAARNAAGYRAKRAAVALSGVGMNLATGAIALMAGAAPTSALVVASGITAIANLLPVTAATSQGKRATDGLLLLRTVTASRERLAEQLDEEVASRDVLVAERLVVAGDANAARGIVHAALERRPQSRILRSWLGLDMVRGRRFAEARTLFQDLVAADEPGARDASRAIHLNNLAWADLMLDDPALIQEADAASARALELLPGAPALLGTRAFALVAAGRAREAIALARRAARAHAEPSDRASAAAVLAMAYARDWRLADARRWLEEASRLDPTCDLLSRAEAAVRSPAPPRPDLSAPSRRIS